VTPPDGVFAPWPLALVLLPLLTAASTVDAPVKAKAGTSSSGSTTARTDVGMILRFETA
jgi:hypothetical protein